MQLRLKWNNPNLLATTVSIYRSDTQVAVTELGAPLITLPGGTVEWTDASVVRDATYYYYWKVTAGADSVWSIPFKVLVAPYSGPGPEKIVYGTYDLGYCGMLSWQDMFTADEVLELSGTSKSFSRPTNSLVTWVKWVRNGKYLFIPTTPLGSVSPINLIYRMGVQFGVTGPGPWKPSGEVDRDQMVVIEKGIHRYIVRQPTGSDDRNNPTRTLSDDALVTVRRYSETSDIYYPMGVVVTPSQRLPGLLGLFNTAIVTPSFPNTLTQERYKGGTLIGMRYSSNGSDAGAALEDLGALTTGNAAWLPVLELIPTQTLEVKL